MNKIFNKENAIPALHRKRSFANIIDSLAFVGYLLLIVNIPGLSGVGKLILSLAYLLIYLPLAYALGGTAGQIILTLRIRKYDDYNKRISIFAGYKRLFLLITNQWLGFLTFSRKRKFVYEQLSGTIMLQLNVDNEDETVQEFQKKVSRWKCVIACAIYSLWVYWVGNYWLIFGNIVVFDLYITKKIPWDFWKKTKDGKQPSAFVEWTDALIFALFAVYMINIFLFQNYKIPTSSLEKSLLVGDHLFVSKVSYGPRMPITPIAFPLVQNTFPVINTKSYTAFPHWDYKRLKGFGDVKHNDIVVFNFPAGDTVPFLSNNPSYFEQALQQGAYKVSQNNSLLPKQAFKTDWERNYFLRNIGREIIKNDPISYGEVVYRPVDRRDNYVKRCVALPGDVFEIRSNQIYINGEAVVNPKDIQHNYIIQTDGTSLNERFFEHLGISKADRSGLAPNYYLPLTKEKAERIKKMPYIKSIVIQELKPNGSGFDVFPYSSDYNWSRDNFGPLKMPKAGETVELTLTNLVLYDRVITAYEGNTLDVKEGKIYINSELATHYTFKMNYYFMLGDNRHKSADSRYWGFVPEDHVVGKPILVWLSLDTDKSFPFNIRWDRFFKIVHN